MARTCLPRVARDAFIKAVKDGRLDPLELEKLSSEARSQRLKRIVGDYGAEQVNEFFENTLFKQRRRKSNLLIKSGGKPSKAQKARMDEYLKEARENWINESLDLKPRAKMDYISRLERMVKERVGAEDKIYKSEMDLLLDDDFKDEFLDSYVQKKLGLGVSREETAVIADGAKRVSDTRLARDSAISKLNSGEITSKKFNELSLEHGRAVYDLEKAVKEMKLAGVESVENLLKNLLKKDSDITLKSFFRQYVRKPWMALADIGGFLKATKASLDNSFLLRQGLRPLLDDPKGWLRRSAKSFQDIGRVVWKGRKEADLIEREFFARVYGDIDYDDIMKMKIDLGNIEEAFPTSLPEQIPIAGRFFKASETAFTMNAYRTRFDLAKMHLKAMREGGIPLDTFNLEGTGKYINSLTGRGNLGKNDAVLSYLNNVFFSPRLIKSHFDSLTMHMLNPNMPARLKKKAAFNLFKLIVVAGAVMGVAKAIGGDSVELEPDPRSSNFGKVKVDKTRFDVTGGLSSPFVLAYRLSAAMAGQKAFKSSTTGKLRKLNSVEYGQKTATDMFWNFWENKLSPMGQTMKLLLNKKTFSGEDLNGAILARETLSPIGIQTIIEDGKDPRSAPLLLIILAETLGFGVTTY